MLNKERKIKIGIHTLLAAFLLIIFSHTVFAVSDQYQNKIHNWQIKQIYQPSQNLLDRESRGFVNIYDGFTDARVDLILDDKFDRIDNMMFTHVKITDTAGAVLKDPVTGNDLFEDDGCD